MSSAIYICVLVVVIVFNGCQTLPLADHSGNLVIECSVKYKQKEDESVVDISRSETPPINHDLFEFLREKTADQPQESNSNRAEPKSTVYVMPKPVDSPPAWLTTPATLIANSTTPSALSSSREYSEYYKQLEAVKKREEDMRNEVSKRCMADVGLIKEQLEEQSTLDTETTSREAKCFMHCFYSGIGYLNVDDRYDFENLKYRFSERNRQVLKQCVDYFVSEKDACEYAYGFMLCAHSGTKKG